MEDDFAKPSVKISANELLAFQRDLKKEKELLQKMLAKIDDQVHRLQVEQLHLLGLMNKSLKGAGDESPSHESMQDDQEEQEDPANKSLDLSVAMKFYPEELEDEDDA